MASKKDKKKRKWQEDCLDDEIESDETFAYIAGYTSGGVPYGITWEEMEQIEKEEKQSQVDIEIDLPF